MEENNGKTGLVQAHQSDQAHIIYRGFSGFEHTGSFEVFVELNGYRFPLEHRERHSKDGFSWGYLGSGCADLARSILWHAMGEEPPPWLYQTFKEEVVATWSMDAGRSWSMSRESVLQWATHKLLVRAPELIARMLGVEVSALAELAELAEGALPA